MSAHAAARPSAGSRRSTRPRTRRAPRRVLVGVVGLAATATICAPAAWSAGDTEPAPAAVTPLGTQAEALGLDPHDGRAFHDAKAAGGEGLAIWSEGAAVGVVPAPRDSDALQVRVRGDQCEGAPRMTVALDGQEVATVTVANRRWATVTLPGEWAAGEHQVALTFDNDFLSSCDRNLRIDQLAFVAAEEDGSADAVPSSAAPEPAMGAPAAVVARAAAAAASAEPAAPSASAEPTASAPPSPPAATASAPSAVASSSPSASSSAAAPPASASASASAGPASSPTGTALAGARFWVDPDSDARRELSRVSGDAAATAALTTVAAGSGSVWLGDWQSAGQAQARAQQVTSAAAAAGQVPVLVLYAIPGRDCGGYSAGGLGSPEAYAAWVRAVAAGIGGRRAVVVVEPDSLAQEGCLSDAARAQREAMLRDAVGALAGGGALTYLDGGHSGWVDAATMATRLRAAGVERARGFALNVSNFNRTSDEEGFGEQLSGLLGGARYVVDTSRNGNGPASGALAWCNPGGRAVGSLPTTSTTAAHADAYLWVKAVGQSDGDCGRGDPSAGTWWPASAIQLAKG